MPLSKREKANVKRMITRKIETKCYTCLSTFNSLSVNAIFVGPPINCPSQGAAVDMRDGNMVDVFNIEARGHIYLADDVTGNVEHVHMFRVLLLLDKTPRGAAPGGADVLGDAAIPDAAMDRAMNFQNKSRFQLLSEIYVRTYKFVTSGSSSEGGFFHFNVPISRRNMKHRVYYNAATPKDWGSVAKNALFFAVVTPSGITNEDANPTCSITSRILYKDA